MARAVALAMAVLALMPALALAQGRGLTPRGNPSELVAAESALAHLARDKGANAALLATADDTAELVAPVRTPARIWLKSHDAAAWFAGRQTGTVWASCDGTAGISTGYWRDGWFAVVWKRQKKLNYTWVLADAAPLATMPPAPDWITGKLADCPARIPGAAIPVKRGDPIPLRPLPAAIPPGDTGHDGRSDDGSLVWRSTVLADGSRQLRAWIYQDGAMHAVIERDVAPADGG